MELYLLCGILCFHFNNTCTCSNKIINQKKKKSIHLSQAMWRPNNNNNNNQNKKMIFTYCKWCEYLIIIIIIRIKKWSSLIVSDVNT